MGREKKKKKNPKFRITLKKNWFFILFSEKQNKVKVKKTKHQALGLMSKNPTKSLGVLEELTSFFNGQISKEAKMGNAEKGRNL